MSLLVSSSAARVSCQPDSLPPDAKSTSKSGHSSTLRQFLDNRPQLPRSDVSPSRNLSRAVMASGLIPRDSQCLPASPYPNQSNRKRKLSYLTTMDNLCNVIESQKHWTSGRDGFDTKCKFRFSVYWDQDSMRWYVPKEQQGCLQHAGHMREDPLNIRLNSKFLGTKEQRQNIVDAVDSEVRPASAARIFETQSGEHLDWHQVNYLKRVKGKNASLPNETAADKLIRELSSDASKSFILLFADIDVGSSLITIKTKKRKTGGPK
ncbi:hypothetical protein THAOC_29570 [Thalassiosira oceanica]|uniref:Uncharacterized protein n=1 Tax=Thalassiosira oceanica TaxID=159749 RepID=K0RX35_THAOC|nr:hypothetical protein THAOC_29570 [Thalassiosira oceanica]|eukprot:EJK51272.1 hypothetical protein THAOC_29570 [Thalassiosira oceanica]